jgi:hypothetical protein
MSADVGTLANEAALLLDAVAAKLAEDRQPTGTDGGPLDACPTCGHRPGESCTACPICRFLAVLRGERPEVTARWVDSALTIVQALRALIPEPVPAEPNTEPDSAAPTSPPGGQRLQHIEIR